MKKVWSWRQLPDLGLADQVHAAVADVAHEALAGDDEQRDAGRAHAVTTRAGVGEIVDLGRRLLDGRAQQRLDGVAGRLRMIEGVQDLGLGGDVAMDGPGRRLRGDLAGSVAAHAVADREQAEVLFDEDVVLVVGPALAYVGLAVSVDVHGAARLSQKCRRLPQFSRQFRGPVRARFRAYTSSATGSPNSFSSAKNSESSALTLYSSPNTTRV